MSHSLKIVLKESKKRSIHTDMIIKSTIYNLKESYENDFINISDDQKQYALEKLETSGEIGKNVAAGIGKGVAKYGAKKAAAKGIIATMSKLGIKSIPVIGNVMAALDILVSSTLFIKNLSRYTDLVLEKTGVELEGPTSLLGEYSILELDANNLEKIAIALQQLDMSQEEANELWDSYREAQRDFKSIIINIMLILKEVSLGLGLGLAISFTVLPIETAFREVLFKGHEVLSNVRDDSRFVDVFASIYEAASHLMPFFGFLYSNERVLAFSKIDDAMQDLLDVNSRRRGLEFIKDTAYGSTDLYYAGQKVVDELGDDIGSSIDKAFQSLAENKISNSEFSKKRWEKLSGIN